VKQTVDIRDVMKLSPETVTRVTTERTVLHRKRKPSETAQPVPVERRKVHPAIMEAALRLTNGDVSRINIREDGAIVITTHSRPGVNKSAPR
jgi:hypothetical protein